VVIISSYQKHHSLFALDYEKLLTLLPASSKEHRDAKRALQAVKPRAEAAQKKEMGEMLDKLKGFGNSILGEILGT
jgi:hypothetical protein